MGSYLDTRESSLGYLSSTVARLLGARLTKRFGDSGINLTGEQWSVLIRLWDQDGMNQRDIAASLHLEKSSVSRLVDGLERRGWVVRKPDPLDARQKRIMLTAKGAAIQDETIRLASGVLQEAQQALSRQEQEMLHSLLLRVIRALI